MRFVKESRIAAPPGVVYAFHGSRGALERLTPPWERLRLISGGDSLRVGTRVELETYLGPIRLCWVAEHTENEPGRLFADRQVRGPFARWNHRHLFLDDGVGGTIIRDEVDFDPPFGWMGRRIVQGYLHNKLTRLFDYRHDITRKIVEARDFVAPDFELGASSSVD